MKNVLRILFYGTVCLIVSLSAQAPDMLLIPAGNFQSGGSWSFNAKSVRVANRLAEKPSLLSSDVGFRCVHDVNP